LSNTGTSNNPDWAQINLANGVTGTLGTSNGGTGLTSFTSGGLMYASSTSALTTGSDLTYDGTTLTLKPLSVIGPGSKGSDNNANGGGFLKNANWDAAATTHTISFATYCIDDNSAGLMVIVASDKASGNKAGSVLIQWYKSFGGSTTVSTIATHKSAALTTLTVAASSNNIVVTTDSDCRITWNSLGGV
jgi:hypothetical protein